ncbi:MAG: S-layer homology domain-containing protein, partial [bacterium]|nr:S-layer homology domain-containing protein [bacterium]
MNREVLMARRIVSLLLGTLLSVAVVSPVMAAPSFTDVPDTNVFSDDIEWLARVGITEGCNPPTNDQFCPTDRVTRGQMASFLVRGLGLTDDGGGDHFTDDDGNIFETSIDILYTAGITQ